MTGCTQVRIVAPFAALARQGYHARWLRDGDPRVAAWAQDAAAVILPRAWWGPADRAHGQAILDELHAHGQAVIYEADDDVFSPDCLPQLALIHPAQADVAALEQERQDRVWALQQADGVTVPTEALAAVVRQYTDRPVVVVPNAVDLPAFRAVYDATPRTVSALTIGWAGGQRVASEFTELAAAWAQIAAAYPEVVFVVAGYPAPPLIQAVPRARLWVEPWRPLAQAAAAYRNIDILCCPLTDTAFNQGKSPLKAFEGGAAECAVVASPTVYGEVMRDIHTGLLTGGRAGWTAALSLLLEDGVLRRQLAARWAKRVRERHSLAVTVGAWPQAWQRIVAAYRGRRAA
jgi:glycosyltransferase involved in cell wall biosynthesis